MADFYMINNTIRFMSVFKDNNNENIDLDPIKLTLQYPDDTSDTFEYVEHGEVIKRDGVGSYYADIVLDQSGEWVYNWFSDGDNVVSAEGIIRVAPSLLS
jgi:hypothetical protein